MDNFQHQATCTYSRKMMRIVQALVLCFFTVFSNGILTNAQCPSTAPFTDSFDGVTTPALPSCWSEIDISGNDLLTADQTNNNVTQAFTPPSSPNVVEFNNGDITSGDTAMLISPSFTDLSNGTNRIRFEAFLECGSDEELLIGVMSDSSNSSTYEPYDTIKNSEMSTTTFKEFIVNLDDLNIINSNDQHVALMHGDGACEILVDDFNYESIPSCQRPVKLTVDNTFGDSAQLSWTSGNSSNNQWIVEYGKSGFSYGSGNTKLVSDTFTTLTGLANLTSYDFYVKEICSATDTSLEKGPASFSTQCGSYTFPYSQTFDGGSTPSCWSTYGDETWEFSTGANYGASSAGDHTGNGGNYAWVDGSSNSGGDTAVLESAKIESSSASNNAGIEFYIFSNNTDNPGDNNTLRVDFYDGSTWHDSVVVHRSDDPSWLQKTIDFSNYSVSGAVKVRFVVRATASTAYYNDILIDDFRVLENQDVQMQSLQLEDACDLSANETLTGVIENAGIDTINTGTSIGVGYQVDNKSVISETLSTSSQFKPGDTIHYNFNAKMDLSTDGKSYAIQAWTDWSNDNFQSNDSVKGTQTNIKTPASPTVIGDTVCSGNSATLISKTPDSLAQEWYDSAVGGSQLSTADTFTTANINKPDTFYAAASKVTPQLKITEVNMGTTDSVEIQNISNSSIDANGWTVAIGDDDNVINDVLNPTWSLGNIPAKGIQTRNDNNWGSNISWVRGDNGWVIIIDDQGEIVDFVAWGWSASEINSMNVTINGFNVTIGDEWDGAGATSCSSDNLLRVGNKDNNSSADFTCGSRSASKQNPNLNLSNWQPESAGCISNRVPVYVSVGSASTMTLETGSPFKGKDSGGTKNSRDIGCVGDTLTYEVLPPQGYSNSDYGQKWSVKSQSFSLNSLNSDDTTFIQPSNNQNGQFRIVIDSAMSGKQFNLTVTLTSAGCNQVGQRFIKASPYLNTDFNVTSACEGDSVRLMDNSQFNGANSNLSYQWNLSDGSQYAKQNVNHLFPDSGQYSATLTVQGQLGCGESLTKNVDVYHRPVADFLSDSVCQGQSLSFNNQTSGNTNNYEWDFGDTDTSGRANPTHLYDTSGQFMVQLIATAPKGCSDTVQKSIEVQPSPSGDFTFSNSCSNLDVEFIDQSSFAGMDKNLTYNWDFGDGNTAMGDNPIHNYSNAMKFTVELTVKDTSTQCFDTISRNVNVEAQPSVDFNANEACFGDSTSFQYTGDPGASNIDWSYGNNQSIGSTQNTKYFFSEVGDYQVTLSGSFNNGACTSDTTKTVTVNPKPEAGFTKEGTCVGESIDFTDTTNFQGSQNNLQRKWYFGNGDSSTGQNPSKTYSSSGQFSVTLVVSSGQGCKDTAAKSVTIAAKPTSDFTVQDRGSGVYAFSPQDSSYQSYEWDFGDGNTETGQNVTHEYQSNGNFTVNLKVESSNGCTSQSSNDVTIELSGIAKDKTGRSFEVYPNPFDGSTRINYTLQKPGKVQFLIHNAKGKKVMEHSIRHSKEGDYSLPFEPANNSGGVYFIQMIREGDVQTKRVVNLK